MKVRVGRAEVNVKPTLSDRVVGWFSPGAALDRLRSRAFYSLAGGYAGGRKDRRATRNWRPKEQSVNADVLPDLPDLRSRSRDLARNAPIATGAFATTVTNVVGEGLTVQSTVDREVLGLEEEQAKAWQRQAEREFALWCSVADFTCALGFQEMQALIFRTVLESGDLLVVRRWRMDPGDASATKLQLVEADRISNKDRAPDTATQVAGVKFNADGVAIGWEIASRHPDDTGIVGGPVALEWMTVPAWDPVTGRPLALHLFDRLRPEQARGVPWLAPVVEALKTLSDYAEAELRAATIAAMFTAFVTKPALDDGTIAGSGDGEDVADPDREISVGDAGAFVDLVAGEDVKFPNPGRPNPIFDAFTMAVLRQIGVALELPFELLVKHFTASYSASRAALEMAWQFFRRRRTWLARRLCQPVYEWAIEEAVARGRLQAPGFFDDPIKRQAWLRAQWIGPPRISLDPLKEANAHEVELRNGTTSRAEIIVERGGDPDAVHEQLVAEEKRRKDDGLKSPPPQGGGSPFAPQEPAADDADADRAEEDEDREDRDKEKPKDSAA